MTTDAVSAGDDPRRLLSEARGLARRVRADQRVTWLALAVLAGVTFVGVPIDWHFLILQCTGDGISCRFDRQGVLYYWPPALLLAYAAIVLGYIRIARSRGLGARVMPYAITGAALTMVFTAVWVAWRILLPSHPQTEPLPYWVLVLDRLVAPWGTIGVALLVLARLERNLGLLAFTLVYLSVALVPIDFGWHWGAYRTTFLPQQIIDGTLLLAGAIGFALADRRRR